MGSNVIRGVAGFSHITVTDNEIPPPTSDVVHLHTLDNVWINISQVKRKWRHPGESAGIPSRLPTLCSNPVCNYRKVAKFDHKSNVLKVTQYL